MSESTLNRLALPLWSVALALLMLGPALGAGFVLRQDMIWVPDLALRPDFLGVGSALPRAVPSDALVAVFDEVIPGLLLQKLVLIGSLVAAGLGAARLVPGLSLAGRAAALTFYEWNAFVVERLVIGHWPVLIGYAVLPWLVVLARDWRRTGQLPKALPLLLVLGSLSVGSGVATAIALFALAGNRSWRRWLALVAMTLAANAPWLVSGLLHAGTAVTDATSASLFALTNEGSIPAPLAALSLGGIWNETVVPTTRTGVLGWITLLVLLGAALIGQRRWRRRAGSDEVMRVAIIGGVGLLLALATWAGPGAIGWLIETVPGTGVFRDGARFLALLALPLASLVGCAAASIANQVDADNRFLVAGACTLIPVLLIPDAALGASARLKASDYPDEYAGARAAVERAQESTPGDVLLLPLSSYRQPSWNHDIRLLDPLGRYLSPDYLGSDELFVDGVLLPGEDPRVPAAREALAAPDEESRGQALAALGIGIVAIERDAPGQVPQIAGRELYDQGDLRILALDGARDRDVPTSWVLAMSGAWLAFLGLGLVGVLRRRNERIVGHRPL